jgi:SAM-dependent methyltransferase
MSRTLDFYLNGQYFKNNPTWDAADTYWKMLKLYDKILAQLPSQRASVLEIGCGSGALLKKLAMDIPQHSFKGWDIAPDAKRFWEHNQANLSFEVGDFLESKTSEKADIILLIDVLEHLADPGNFLEKLRLKGKCVIIHLPLDMTLMNLIFDQRLVHLRDSIGHIHYFTKALAEKLLRESGYEVVVSEYSNAWKDSPNLRPLGRIMRIFRWGLNKLSPTLNAKILGGETLVLVARSL